MTRLSLGVLSVLLLASSVLSQDQKPKPAGKGVEGTWEGTLKIQAGVELRLAFKFVKNPDGALQGAMDSIDQGAKDLPIDEVTAREGTVSLVMKKLQVTYSGKLDESGDVIQGTFKQGPLSRPMDLKRVAKVTELLRPQEPKRPLPYREEEVTYENAVAKVELAGTLTLPAGDGPFPAVLLISGSGPQDRDEQLLGHKPFLVIADHLTRKGIAVLRVDDRGFGKSTGTFATATSLDFTDDALAGVAFLKSRKEIDAKRISLIGHSEGGLIAPLAATRSKDVASIVLLAGPGVTGAEILRMQGRLIAKGLGTSDAIIDWNEAVQKRIIELAIVEKDDAKVRSQIGSILKDELNRLDEPTRKLTIAQLAAMLPPPSDADNSKKPPEKTSSVEDRILASLEQYATAMMTPWIRFFVAHDPAPTLEKVTCPVLALIGENDLQVPAKVNIAAITAALNRGGNKQATIKELPGLNHLFQTSKTGLPSEYGKIEETFSPAALDLISAWVLERK